jgi:hypothetical protein
LRTFAAVVFFLFSLVFPQTVTAHISLLLHEAIGGAGETTSAGHAAIYFSNICGDQEQGLRPCQPGEPGVVIAAYPDFGLVRKYEWIAVPLPFYLYGLANERDIPLYSNGKVRTLLRNSYRANFLKDAIADTPTDAPRPTRWNQMVGVIYSRDVYAFTVATTKDEDKRFVESFNRRPNEGHFSTMYANCADFAAAVINTYFPKTIHRDLLNDFTMATPKATARQFALSFARRHPERSLTIEKFSQVPGPIHRSFDNRNFSEQAFRSRKYLITEAILNQELLGAFVASYYLTAYFDVNAQHKRFCTRRLRDMQSVDQLPPTLPSSKYVRGFLASEEPIGGLALGLASSHTDRARTFADSNVWNRYRTEFVPMLDRAIANRYFLDKREVGTFFRDLEMQSDPEVTPEGLRLRVKAYGKDTILRIGPNNILAPDSDRMLAYKLLLAVVRADIESSEKNRGPFDKFQANWELLLAAEKQNTEAAPAYCQRRFLDTPIVVPFRKRLLTYFLLATH